MGDRKDMLPSDEVEKLDGSLERSKEKEEKLAKTVIEDDGAEADGKLLNEAIDRGISFNSEIMFNNIVSSYKNVKDIYGETFIRELTGYDSKYLDRNAKIPEFQRKIKDVLNKKVDEMKKKKLITKTGHPTNAGVKLASISLCIEELDKINPKDVIGEKVQENYSLYGQKYHGDDYSSRNPRYRDIEMKRTIKTAIRRGHKHVEKDDLKFVRRKSKGSIYVVYGLDVSGSMKGPKLNVAKKSGVALAYKATSQNDKVGLIAFNSEIVKELEPVSEFNIFLDNIVSINASKETNLVHAIDKSIELFPSGDATKHLVLLTDAVPTVGDSSQTIEAVMRAKASNITISIVGIKLTEGLELAQTIVEVSNGKLYVVRNLDEVESIILEDYYSL